MSVSAKVAARYSQALILAADESNQLGSLRESLEGLISLLSEVKEFSLILSDPTISAADKSGAVDAALRRGMPEFVLRFLKLLISHRREGALLEIVEAALLRLDEREGVAEAFVVSKFPMTDSQLAGLSERLWAITGKVIRLSSSVDEDMSGGFIVRIGDTVYDATVAAQLRRMREQLTRITA